MSTETGTDLVVLDRLTGELLKVREASTEQLAQFCTNRDELNGQIADAAALVNDELVRRLDMDACWTLRVGDPKTMQWEIKAPSSADVETYPPAALEQRLFVLLAEETISETAAEAALKRTLTVEFVVPFDTAQSIEDLGDALSAASSIEIDGVTVKVTKVTAGRKIVAAGIAKLRKVPGAIPALDAVMERLPAGQRRASVKLKTKAALR